MYCVCVCIYVHMYMYMYMYACFVLPASQYTHKVVQRLAMSFHGFLAGEYNAHSQSILNILTSGSQ